MPAPLASIEHGKDSIWGNDIELKPGKKILLNASSGKGKSTFTTTIFGLRRDYTGTLSYDDKDTRNLTVDDWTKIRMEQISVVFQDLQLFPKLTVQENLILKNSLTDTFTEKELKTLLERLEIDNKWNQQCGLLSMGQQQRVAICRALICRPKVLLADEPTGALDQDTSKQLMHLLQELNKNDGVTIFMITHDQEIASYADRVLSLVDGRL